MNLAAAFARCAEKHAKKIAIFWGETEISYDALLAQSKKVAACLQTRFGVKPGDRVVAVGQLKLQSGAAVTISAEPPPPIPANPPRY